MNYQFIIIFFVERYKQLAQPLYSPKRFQSFFVLNAPLDKYFSVNH